MKPIYTKAVMAAALAFTLAGSVAAFAASAEKQQTGEGDTGYGDRAPSIVSKQQTGEGDTGYGDRAPSIVSKQQTGAADRSNALNSVVKP